MDLLQRLERLPLGRPHLKLLLQGGLGYTFDGMDGAIVAFLLPPVTALWSLSSGQVGLLGSSVLIGYLFGALSAGVLGDLIGRRMVMMAALAVYAIASLIAAAAPSWEFLFAFRVIAGFGTGAESAIIAPFLAEFIPARYRGRFVGSLAGFFSFGFVLAALLGYFIVSANSQGWRIVQVLTAVPIVLLLWWRRSIPESPRYLLARGRLDEAEAVVADLERRTVAATGRPLEQVSEPAPEAPPTQPARGSLLKNLAYLWSRDLAKRTAVVWVIWFAITFSFYGFFTWIPSLLVDQGLTITKSFGFSLLIYLAQIPGYYSAAFLSERLDRKWTMAGYLVGGALSALGLALAGSNTGVLVAGIFLSLFMNGTYATVYSYTPEVYPTAIRSTGMGTASAFGRVGGILAPIIIGVAYSGLGFSGVFVMTCAVLGAGVVAVVVFGLRTAGRTLEELTERRLRRQRGLA